jgi:hypothetical protein
LGKATKCLVGKEGGHGSVDLSNVKAERTPFPREGREQSHDDSNWERCPGISAIIELNAGATARVRIDDVRARPDLKCRLRLRGKVREDIRCGRDRQADDGERKDRQECPTERLAVEANEADQDGPHGDEKKIISDQIQAHEARDGDRELEHRELF